MITKKYSISVYNCGISMINELFVSRKEFEMRLKELDKKVVVNKDNGEDEYDRDNFDWESDIIKSTEIIKNDDTIRVIDYKYSVGTIVNITK